mgnify:CR=1 FL=1
MSVKVFDKQGAKVRLDAETCVKGALDRGCGVLLGLRMPESAMGEDDHRNPNSSSNARPDGSR